MITAEEVAAEEDEGPVPSLYKSAEVVIEVEVEKTEVTSHTQMKITLMKQYHVLMEKPMNTSHVFAVDFAGTTETNAHMRQGHESLPFSLVRHSLKMHLHSRSQRHG